jgi:hypothetical protein
MKGQNIMKMALYGLFALMVALPAFAADSASGLTTSEAEAAVVHQAHKFISENAPDFGGNVHSPCNVETSGSDLTVTCSGVANETTAGDGSYKVRFKCVGNFARVEDGDVALYFQAEPTKCE